MKTIAMLLTIITSSAFAATNGFDLKLDLSMNGKHVSSPHIIVKAGETAKVQQKTDHGESFIEVVATEGEIQNHKGILMKFVVGTINEKGERIIQSQPQVLAKENEKALITVGNKSGEELSLSVLAQRKSL